MVQIHPGAFYSMDGITMVKDSRIKHISRHYDSINHAESYFTFKGKKHYRSKISKIQFDRVFSNIDLVTNGSKPMALDIGCSSGRYTNALKKLGYDAIGIDTAIIPLRFATRRSSAKFARASATELPFKGKMFDIVICIELFHHFEDDNLKFILDQIS